MYDKDRQESKASKNVQTGEKGKRDTLIMTLEAVKTDIANIPGCIPCKLYAGDTPTCTILYANTSDIFNFGDLNPCFEIANMVCFVC